MGSHELKRLGARRRIVFQAFFAVHGVTGIEEWEVVAVADERIKLLGAETLVEIDELERLPSRLEVLFCLAAGGSSGFGVEGERHGSGGGCSLAHRPLMFFGPPADSRVSQ